MDDTPSRASLIEIKRAYDHFFNKGATLLKIKDTALGDSLYPTPLPSKGSIGVPGRSFAWKLFLLQHEPLATSPVCAYTLLEAVRLSRESYRDLLLEKMKAPDGSYDADLVVPGTVDTKVKDWKRERPGSTSSANHNGNLSGGKMNLRPEASSNLEFNNPLSLHNENPWNDWFASVELRKTILQDVERTFPEVPYFRKPDVQLQLTNILFLFSVQHPAIGYRQGMHELLAPLYHAVAFDAIMEEQEGTTVIADSSLKELCSSLWVASDAWSLFEAIMRGVARWYEWREPSKNPATNGRSSSALPTMVYLNLNEGQSGQGALQPYVAPIVKTCNTIQGTFLKSIDPQLYNALQNTGIEPQIYGIRWLRLLFTRELNMPDALRLWDGLFACDPTLDLAQWICVAMLIRVRNDLIPTDYSGQLSLLLRYSTPTNAENANPHHAVLLLRQALALQMAPNVSTGASVIIENKTILDIPVEVPPPTQTSSRRSINRQHNASPAKGHNRVPSSPSMGLPEIIARGLLERGESLGINKTLMSAVSELKRNIPDLAASLVRPSSHTDSAFPLEDERPAQERPPWEPRTRFEMEHDVTQLRTRDKKLGDSLGWIVDVLLQDEEEVENRERLKKEKREAIESLSYIRDVLISDATELEGDRLIGEEEALRRKARGHRSTGSTGESSRRASSTSQSGMSQIVSPPAPLPVIDSRLRSTGNHHWPQPQGTSLPGVPQSRPPPIASTGVDRPVLAPWQYTRSNFSGTRTLNSATLPRPPPPTSRNLRRGEERSSDQSPPRGEIGGYGDPLGAMR